MLPDRATFWQPCALSTIVTTEPCPESAARGRLSRRRGAPRGSRLTSRAKRRPETGPCWPAARLAAPVPSRAPGQDAWVCARLLLAHCLPRCSTWAPATLLPRLGTKSGQAGEIIRGSARVVDRLGRTFFFSLTTSSSSSSAIRRVSARLPLTLLLARSVRLSALTEASASVAQRRGSFRVVGAMQPVPRCPTMRVLT